MLYQQYTGTYNPLGQFHRDKPALIDLSRFDGSFAESWVFQANQFFNNYGIYEEYRLFLLPIYFEVKLVNSMDAQKPTNHELESIYNDVNCSIWTEIVGNAGEPTS